jgi:hypothetical protein
MSESGQNEKSRLIGLMSASAGSSGHNDANGLPPLGAKTGREQMQQMTWRAAPLFDHLIGALLQKERHVQAERPWRS